MAYLKINGNDYSMYVNGLKVDTKHVYSNGTLSSGVDWAVLKRTKHSLTVSIIPLDSAAMASLLSDINSFKVTVDYRDPNTNTLREGVAAIISINSVEYYTIQADKVLYKGFMFVIEEL